MLTRNLFYLLAIAFLALGCADDRKQIVGAQSGFEMRTLSGETLAAKVEPSDGRYNDLILTGRAKPALYVFFTTICPECKKEFPHLIDIKNRYGDKIDLIGVLVENKTVEEAADFAAQYKLNYPIVIGAGAYRLSDAVGGVNVVPSLHIYDGSGKYVAHFVGPAPQEMLETRLNTLIKTN